MEDEKIIELYLSRSEEAIPKTEEKFGKLCVSIAKNILVSEEDEILYEGRKFSEKEAEKTGIYEKYTHLFTDRMLCEI